MKKIYALILAVVLILAIPTVAFATSGKLDIDLSKLSYDELVELKDQINLAIWQSEEWEEVEVPHGIWLVGTDIPEGKWTVTVSENCNLRFDIGRELDETGAALKSTDHWWRLKSSSRRTFDPASDVESITVELQKGTYVSIDEGSVIFTPYSGKPSLGFKK